jgi:formate dehydrogenase major subunit
MEKEVRGICPYCGCGCSFYFRVKDNKIVCVKGDIEDDVSEGVPCIKGFTCYECIFSEDRIKNPMIRKQGKLKDVSWGEVYNFIYKKLKKLNGNEISFYISSPATNEDCYLFQKFAREIFHSGNIDSCARLCHASTCYAMNKVFGVGGMTARIDDLKKADCVLILGSNPKFTYPNMYKKMNKEKIIYAGPFRNESAQGCKFININDGSDIVFLNCILNLLKVRLPKDIKKIIKLYGVERAKEICGVDENKLKEVVKLIKKSRRFVLCFGMGLTQHVYGVNNVLSAINLVIAKKGKLIPMRGKVNIQGVGDMGCLPKTDTFISSVFLDSVKAFYIVESNPAMSLPDLNQVHKIFSKRFLILQCSFPNKTMKFADVVLPSCLWCERNGTFTTAESRVRYFEKAVEPCYGKENWKIIQELGNKFGKFSDYKNAEEILKEIKKNVKGYNLNIKKLIKGKDQFVKRRIKTGKYSKVEHFDVEGLTDDKYPVLLTTIRSEYQFCTGDMSKRTRLNKLDSPYCYISKKDAGKYKIRNGKLIKVISRFGSIKVKARISNKVNSGLVLVPFNFDSVLVNKIIPLQFSPIVEEPNFKKIAVRIENV